MACDCCLGEGRICGNSSCIGLFLFVYFSGKNVEEMPASRAVVWDHLVIFEMEAGSAEEHPEGDSVPQS